MINNVIRCYTTDWGRFSGRLGRGSFWLFYLSVIVFFIILFKLEAALGMSNIIPLTLKGNITINHVTRQSVDHSGLGWLTLLFTLYVFVPYIAAVCRRLHDTGRSGWWQLVGIIPIIGTIIWLIFLILGGTQGANQYGEEPQ